MKYLLILLLPFTIFSQEIVKCNDSLNFIVFKFENDFITFKTDEKIELMHSSGSFHLNDNFLFSIKIVPILNNDEKSNDELSILTDYATTVIEKSTKNLKELLKLYKIPIEINNYQTALFWHFKLPENLRVEVEKKGFKLKELKVVYLSTTIENSIVNIETILMKNENIEEIKSLFLDIMKTIKLTKTKNVCFQSK